MILVLTPRPLSCPAGRVPDQTLICASGGSTPGAEGPLHLPEGLKETCSVKPPAMDVYFASSWLMIHSVAPEALIYEPLCIMGVYLQGMFLAVES